MSRKIVCTIFALLIISALAVTSFAEEIPGTEPIGIPESSISPLATEIVYDTKTIGAYGYYDVPCSSSSNGYFTSTPGTTCTLRFTATSNSMDAIRITIGGMPYNATINPTPVGDKFSYYVIWTVDTATPYTIRIQNMSAATVQVTAISVVY